MGAKVGTDFGVPYHAYIFNGQAVGGFVNSLDLCFEKIPLWSHHDEQFCKEELEGEKSATEKYFQQEKGVDSLLYV